MNNSLKIAYIELHYLPSLPYMGLFTLMDKVFLDFNDVFYKQTYRNRTVILTANKVLPLIIPVKKGKTAQLATKVLIDESTNWKHIHRQSIISAYANAPYFDHYSKEILDCFHSEENSLFKFNLSLLKIILSQLGLENKLVTDEEVNINKLNFDYRNKIQPGKKSTSVPMKFNHVPYYQVFGERHGFVPDLSILDLIFNEGPESVNFLRKMYLEF